MTTRDLKNDLVWLHIGAGSFHRAHQAVYLHRLRERGNDEDRRWQLALANIRPDMAPLLQELQKNEGCYTLETVTPQGQRAYETIRAIRDIVPWDAQLKSLVKTGAEPRTRVISFTVTEGGYYLDHEHLLDVHQPDLAADIDGDRRTIYGAITAILQARYDDNAGGVTLLNCDNLRHNGERFLGGLQQFLALRGHHQLLEWVRNNVTSPNSMVDRITPRPTDAVRQRVKEATGVDDPCALMAESFIQWVIEDDFKAGRPALDKVGVEMVASVLPYEEAKIRILNASHSCIAWAGTLAGLNYIHEGTAREDIHRMACEYVTQDVIPSLTPSPLDLEAYRDTTLARFGNPAIQDTNQRVAADGFSKIPGFIRPTISDSLARGHQPRATAQLPALFFVFLQRWKQSGLSYEYQDGVFDPAATRAMLDAADPLRAYCADPLLWGELAGTASLERLLREAVADVNAWLAASTKMSA
ncbi:mannitol-1-phosphate/altronate dehydrogenase [Herbaspirillum sp. CF444]|uniref:D-arabinitol 4-dehydrogenase n=1 Tax=Herbaspirillum sp. CF444 TaxID=1144319 RepID=UPI000272694E|nr:D-arabinitol 4-dehydrogenase [Herbaspirillum sp. CF444]EJL82558.1 mannitol-1-phosphate/altronate dehydrogenase [Herbaspirillum sp. CF444]